MKKDFTKVREFLDSFLETGLPGFDCIIFHDGECVLRHMGGYSCLETKTPLTGKELYNIYSCSKPITVTAALMLLERGLLRLEDKLSDYIPEYETMYVRSGAANAGSTDGINLSFEQCSNNSSLQKAKNPITIKDLFSMKAGFSYDIDSPSILLAKKETKGLCPTLETVKYLAKEPLRYEPGEGYGYSLAHDVLAAVIEVISKQKFGDFVAENIFKPLEMTSSTFTLPESRLSEVAEQYQYDDETKTFKNVGKEIQYYKFGSEYQSGGAGCVSSVEDYGKFLEALRCGKLISQQTIDLLTTPCTTDEQYPNELYGYGLGVRCPKPQSTATDFGWGGHAGAYLAIDRKNKISFYYSQHAVGAPNNRSNQIIWKVKEVLGVE